MVHRARAEGLKVADRARFQARRIDDRARIEGQSGEEYVQTPCAWLERRVVGGGGEVGRQAGGVGWCTARG